jgi:TolA-binding protein
VSKKFNDASSALGFPKIKLDDTISSMTSTAVLSASKAKVDQYTALVNSPSSTLGQCQDALDELQATIDDHHQLMLDNQQTMTDAKTRQAVLEEVDSIYSHCKSAKQQIADYTAAGDIEMANDTQTWLDSFRSAIAPEIISFVDDLILFDEQRYDPAYTTPTTTAAATPAPNSGQVVGQLSA